MTIAEVKIPEKLIPIFNPSRGSVQYRGAHGGRGSGKSRNFAEMSAVWGYAEPLRILCVRRYQTSIRDSFHAELKNAISNSPWLDHHYDVGRDYLRSKNGKTEYLFMGLQNSIKSTANIDLTIVEEAEDLEEHHWLDLEATVFRRPKSELWAIWNPRMNGSPVDERFIKHPPKNALITEMNWTDNTFFPPNMQILRKREQDRLDDNTYAHIWEGKYLENSDSQVFANKYKIEEFEVGKDWVPMQGGDFGFAMDPTAAVRCYEVGDKLYVRYEAGRTKLEIDRTAPYITRRIPRFEDYVTRWDSARPESINYLARHGLPKSKAVEKWKGSVEDGIAFLRSYKAIVIHPDCKELIREMRVYSYKIDKKTGDILPDVVDANNHYIDALRYAVEPLTKRNGKYGLLGVL